MIRLPALGRVVGHSLCVTRRFAATPVCQGLRDKTLALSCRPFALGGWPTTPGQNVRGGGNAGVAHSWRRLLLGGLAAGGGASLLAAKGPARCDEGTLVDKSSIGELTLQRRCVAEAIGTGIIVTLGCGVVCSAKYCASAVGAGHMAAVWGMAVALAVYATRDISGAHLNPAVTCSLAANKDFPKEEIVPYICSQTFGATVAGAINYLICSAAIAAFEMEQGIVRGTAASAASFSGAFGMTPNPQVLSPLGALAAEVYMTAILVFMIFAITDDTGSVPGGAAPALIGATVASLVSVFGSITGCGMNPARDVGPRLVSAVAGWSAATLPSCWVYTLGPIVGAILGGALYQQLLAKKP